MINSNNFTDIKREKTNTNSRLKILTLQILLTALTLKHNYEMFTFWQTALKSMYNTNTGNSRVMSMAKFV